MAGDIPNGMLCYTGLTPGSTATYSCDKGYELSGISIVLECLPNGVWNSVAPACVQLDTGTNISFLFPRSIEQPDAALLLYACTG